MSSTTMESVTCDVPEYTARAEGARFDAEPFVGWVCSYRMDGGSEARHVCPDHTDKATDFA